MGMTHKKSRTAGKKAPAYRGKSGQNTGTDFLALGLRVVLSLPKSGKKKSTNPNFVVWIWWGGGLPREGGGPKSSACPSKPRENNKLFSGISEDFRRDVPGAHEKFDKKSCVQ